MTEIIKKHDIVKYGERVGTVLNVYYDKICVVEFIENNVSEFDDIEIEKLIKIQSGEGEK